MKAPKYGFEATVSFGASVDESKEKQAVDIMANDDVAIWRVSAFSNRSSGLQQLIGRLIYGTGSSIEINNLFCPIVAFIPGNVQLYLAPGTSPFLPAPLKGHVSVAAVSSQGTQILRSRVDAAAGPVDLGATAVAYTAYTASTLTVAGIGAIAVAVGQTLKLIGPARLTAGSGIAEHDT